jgi:hypothetical protein
MVELAYMWCAFAYICLNFKIIMAKDKYHAHVRSALENDGWTITHDPYKVMIGRRRGYIDLGAELIAAEKNGIL